MPHGVMSLVQNFELKTFLGEFGVSYLSGHFQNLDDVTLPNGLRCLTFDNEFDQSLDKVAIPELIAEFGLYRRFNQGWTMWLCPVVCGWIYWWACAMRWDASWGRAPSAELRAEDLLGQVWSFIS